MFEIEDKTIVCFLDKRKYHWSLEMIACLPQFVQDEICLIFLDSTSPDKTIGSASRRDGHCYSVKIVCSLLTWCDSMSTPSMALTIR